MYRNLSVSYHKFEVVCVLRNDSLIYHEECSEKRRSLITPEDSIKTTIRISHLRIYSFHIISDNITLCHVDYQKSTCQRKLQLDISYLKKSFGCLYIFVIKNVSLFLETYYEFLSFSTFNNLYTFIRFCNNFAPKYENVSNLLHTASFLQSPKCSSIQNLFLL